MSSPAQIFSANLIAQLASYGVEFWLAPGARSQSLAIAAAQIAEGDIGQLVEAQLPVGLGIGDFLVQVGALQHFVVAMMLHRDRQADLERAHPHVDAR